MTNLTNWFDVPNFPFVVIIHKDHERFLAHAVQATEQGLQNRGVSKYIYTKCLKLKKDQW